MATEYQLPFDNPDAVDGFGSTIGRTHPHRGVDFAQPVGARIRAIADGVVVSIDFDGVLGWHTVLKHTRTLRDRLKGAKPVYSGYCHQDAVKLSLHVGQSVARGALIGYVGRTGEVTGPHLHLTMSHDPRGVERGEVFDPLKFIARYPVRPTSAKFIRIKPGANLSRIATQYDTTVTQLVRLNGIVNADLIRAGAKLRVK